MNDSQRAPQAERFFGSALMAIGALIGGLCGACTLFFAVGTVWSAFANPGGMGSLNFLVVPIMVGGLPTFAGVSLFLAGLRRYRGGRKPDRNVAKTFD